MVVQPSPQKLKIDGLWSDHNKTFKEPPFYQIVQNRKLTVACGMLKFEGHEDTHIYIQICIFT